MNTIKTEDAPEYGNNPIVTRDHQQALDDEVIRQAKLILLNRMKKRGPALSAPDVVKDFLTMEFFYLEHEEFIVLFLDSQHQLIEWESMFRGTLDGASVYPREVVKAALRYNAGAVIFAHNHPSGVPTPSQADKTITDKLKNALDLVGVRVLDHFIIGDSIYAFSEHGLI